MARATMKTSTWSKLAPEAPKKKLGRPLGSKNKAKPATTRKTAALAKNTTVRKPTTAAPRSSKADLEIQVVKLERSLARARKQNAALKREVAEANGRADAAETRKPAPKPARVATKEVATPARGRRKKSPVAINTNTTDDVAEAEAETEAHAS